MRPIKELIGYLIEFFSFSFSEKKGLIFFVIIYLMVLAFTELQPKYSEKEIKYDISAFKEEVEVFLANPETKRKINKKIQNGSKELPTVILFKFNPNKLSYDSMLLLGITEFAANNIVKYRNKGGAFHHADDFKRIYGISADDFNTLSSYLLFDNLEEPGDSNTIIKQNEVETISAPICINLADEIELQEVRGIGPVFASRIVKYRSQLGGFVNIDQLLEVYGIDDENFGQLSEQLTIRDSSIKGINLNNAQAKELIAHPYIENWNVVNAIINYRDQHGPFNSCEELLKIHLIDSNIYDKILPYLQLPNHKMPQNGSGN